MSETKNINGINLKEIVNRTGLKAVFIADKLHYSKSSVSRIINGTFKGNVRGERRLRILLTEYLIDFCNTNKIEITDCLGSLSINNNLAERAGGES